MKTVPEIRYDLAVGIEAIDLTSAIGLVALSARWAAVNAELAREVLDLEPFEEPGEWRCLQPPRETR